jgi:hypothetical protein
VITPNRLILTDGFRRDHIYTREKASEEERNGRVRRGEITFSVSFPSPQARVFQRDSLAENQHKGRVTRRNPLYDSRMSFPPVGANNAFY